MWKPIVTFIRKPLHRIILATRHCTVRVYVIGYSVDDLGNRTVTILPITDLTVCSSTFPQYTGRIYRDAIFIVVFAAIARTLERSAKSPRVPTAYNYISCSGITKRRAQRVVRIFLYAWHDERYGFYQKRHRRQHGPFTVADTWRSGTFGKNGEIYLTK